MASDNHRFGREVLERSRVLLMTCLLYEIQANLDVVGLDHDILVIERRRPLRLLCFTLLREKAWKCDDIIDLNWCIVP